MGFSITSDDLRVIDYIDRDMLMSYHSDLESLQPDQIEQTTQERVDLSAEPQWSKDDFVSRQVPQYKRKFFWIIDLQF